MNIGEGGVRVGEMPGGAQLTGLSRRAAIAISILVGVIAQFLSASFLITEFNFQFHLGAYLMFLYPGVLVGWVIISKSRGIEMFTTNRGWGFLAFVLAGIATELGLIALNLLYGGTFSALAAILVNSGLAALASFGFFAFVIGLGVAIDKLQTGIYGKLQVGEQYDLTITKVDRMGRARGKIGRSTIYVSGVSLGWHGRVKVTRATPGLAEAVPVD